MDRSPSDMGPNSPLAARFVAVGRLLGDVKQNFASPSRFHPQFRKISGLHAAKQQSIRDGVAAGEHNISLGDGAEPLERRTTRGHGLLRDIRQFPERLSPHGGDDFLSALRKISVKRCAGEPDGRSDCPQSNVLDPMLKKQRPRRVADTATNLVHFKISQRRAWHGLV